MLSQPQNFCKSIPSSNWLLDIKQVLYALLKVFIEYNNITSIPVCEEKCLLYKRFQSVNKPKSCTKVTCMCRYCTLHTEHALAVALLSRQQTILRLVVVPKFKANVLAGLNVTKVMKLTGWDEVALQALNGK